MGFLKSGLFNTPLQGKPKKRMIIKNEALKYAKNYSKRRCEEEDNKARILNQYVTGYGQEKFEKTHEGAYEKAIKSMGRNGL